MNGNIAHITLVVKDYDEAIAFYTEKLGFIVVHDEQLNDSKRWVLIAPSKDDTCRLLLGKARNKAQLAAIGNQTGGRVFLFLHTDDFWTAYHRMCDRSVVFVRPPKKESYGTVAVFQDLYGNLWDLIEPNENSD